MTERRTGSRARWLLLLALVAGGVAVAFGIRLVLIRRSEIDYIVSEMDRAARADDEEAEGVVHGCRSLVEAYRSVKKSPSHRRRTV